MRERELGLCHADWQLAEALFGVELDLLLGLLAQLDVFRTVDLLQFNSRLF